MDHAPIVTPPAARSRPIWQRPVSRRSVLATGAAAATAAALAALWKGNDLSDILDRVRDYTHGYQGALRTPRVRAAHLLRRAGFGATSAELDRYAAMTSTMMTESVLSYQSTSNAALEAQLPTLDLASDKGPTPGAVQAWWLQRMVQTARPLEEKMTLFWHGLLTSGLDKAGPAQLYTQNQLFRKMALANFVEMLVPLTATAERLSARLFTFFAYPNPEPEIVRHLADTFQQSHYNVGALVREIFAMDAFYAPKAYRALIKSPVELAAQTLRATGSDARAYGAAVTASAAMGQVL